MVEDPELIAILKYLNPLAKLVKADTVKKNIMRLYDEGTKEMRVCLLKYTIIAMVTSYIFDTSRTFFRSISLGFCLKSHLQQMFRHH